MSELVFCKLGGSLITDKLRFETPRKAVIERLAQECKTALDSRPDMQLVLGHGSGSFGHFVADRFKVHEGHLEDWRGYVETAAAAQRLNRLVLDALLSAGVPAVTVQPSASARCHQGELVEMNLDTIATLLEHDVVPLVYGDVSLDDSQGCAIISTEQVFGHLARSLRPDRMIMVGEVAGVYSGDPQRDTVVRLVPEINSGNYFEIHRMLSTSFGVDVTGGMLTKVEMLYALAQDAPNMQVRIITGRRGHLVERILIDPDLAEGTLVRY